MCLSVPLSTASSAPSNIHSSLALSPGMILGTSNGWLQDSFGCRVGCSVRCKAIILFTELRNICLCSDLGIYGYWERYLLLFRSDGKGQAIDELPITLHMLG